jgi:signal transduction histidine kinase
VLLTVCDNGPGVPPEYRERIFEPFFRLPGASERVGGVGLGLALVKSIVERHHGVVRCTAREGFGACFEVKLSLG